jgi:hypothetical protein
MAGDVLGGRGMIHSELNHAEIDDLVIWSEGYRHYRARVHDTHRSGLILRLRGKFLNYAWDYFDNKGAVVVPFLDEQGLMP